MKHAKPSEPARPVALAPPRTDLPRIGLALGGGGARGLAHIHVIEELDALGIRPTAIAGSSIGAIMGAAMAAGLSGKDIHAYANTLLRDRAQVAGRIWRARPSSINEFFAGGIRVTQFNVEKLLKAFLPEALPHNFVDLKIPLKVTATDYYNQSLAILEEGELYSALAASAALPAVFRPVRRDGKIFIDGGIYDPVPFDVFGDDVDMVIAIDVVGSPAGKPDKLPSAIDSMFGASQLMMQSIIKTKLKMQKPDILLRPSVSKFRVLDFMKIDAILHETLPIRAELRHALEAQIPQLRQVADNALQG